ncbi:MAG: hypothetical protein ACKVOK_01390 [Flavobacteriales bacterium]
MMRILGLSFVFMALISCDLTIYPPLSSLNDKKNDEEGEPAIKLHRIEEAQWISYPSKSILWPIQISLYNSDQSFAKSYHSKTFKEVKVLRRSKYLMFDTSAEESCERSYFLEIELDGEIFQVSGSYFMQIDEVPFAHLFWSEKYWRLESLSNLSNVVHGPEASTACYIDERWFILRDLENGDVKIVHPYRFKAPVNSDLSKYTNNFSIQSIQENFRIYQINESVDTLTIPCEFEFDGGQEIGKLHIWEKKKQLQFDFENVEFKYNNQQK